VRSPSTPFTTFSVSGPHGVIIYSRPQLNSTGFFDLELTSLDLIGSAGPVSFSIRESPTLVSSGRMQVTDVGGGDFRIDSFFDVFTEISLNNGQSWQPAQGPPVHFQSDTYGVTSEIPEPGSFLLLAGAGLSLLAVRRRRRC
jgi:PEP-CTERM motif